VQRLFSTFPDSWPGAGLLLLRLAAGAPLIIREISEIQRAPQPAPLILAGAAIAGGGFVLFGLWTPFAGAAEVFLELWSVFSRTAHYESSILLAALATSLVMLGPGAWSIDARLFGRRRIDI
jgi:putative oxidoreductase